MPVRNAPITARGIPQRLRPAVPAQDTVDQAGLGGMLDFTCTDGVVDCEELEKNPLLVGCPAKAKASWALTKCAPPPRVNVSEPPHCAPCVSHRATPLSHLCS